MNYAQTPGFYKLQRAVGGLTDPTQVFLFVGDGSAPKVVKCKWEDTNYYRSMPSQYSGFFEQFFDLPTGIECDLSTLKEPTGKDLTNKTRKERLNAFLGRKATDPDKFKLTWRQLYIINLGYIVYEWQQNRDYWMKPERNVNERITNTTSLTLDDGDATTDVTKALDTMHIQDVFGLKNPFTSDNVVWAVRNGGISRTVDIDGDFAAGTVWALPFVDPGNSYKDWTDNRIKSVTGGESSSTYWRWTVSQWKNNDKVTQWRYNGNDIKKNRYDLDLDHCFLVFRHGNVI